MTATIYSPVNVETRKNIDIKAGDTVRVWIKIQEKGKTRLQAFEGLVLARKHGSEPGATFTVRKIASGVGVEKIFPLYSPIIDKIEIVRRAKVRRSKLYYLREKSAKEIRKKMRGLAAFLPVSYDETPEPEEEQKDLPAQAGEAPEATTEVKADTSTEVSAEETKEEVFAEEPQPEESKEEVKADEPLVQEESKKEDK